MTKINMGNTLDSNADWAGALDAFKEGYRTAVDAKLSSLQLYALQNMHYIYMIRLDDTEEARRTKLLIDELKQPTNVELDDEDLLENHCSETKTELDNLSTDDKSDGSFSPKLSSRNSSKSKAYNSGDEVIEDITLKSLLQSSKKLCKKKATRGVAPNVPCGSTTHSLSKSTGSSTVSRKRVRVIISDDEHEDNEVYCSEKLFNKGPAERIATSDEYMKRIASSPVYKVQIVSPVVSRGTLGACPLDLGTSTCSSKSRSSSLVVQDAKDFRLTGARAAIGSCSFLHNGISTANVHSCCDETCD